MADFNIKFTSSGIRYLLNFVDKQYDIYNPELIRNELNGLKLNQDNFGEGLKYDFPEYAGLKAETGEKVFDLADELIFEHTEEEIYYILEQLDMIELLISQT